MVDTMDLRHHLSQVMLPELTRDGMLAAGGKLFRCMGCPTAFCFDCCPDELVRHSDAKAAEYRLALERRGCKHLGSFLFMTCGSCDAEKAGKMPKMTAAAPRIIDLPSPVRTCVR